MVPACSRQSGQVRELIRMADATGLSVVDAAKRAGVGRSTLYEAIRPGDATARKLGRRTVILQAELHQWLASLPTFKSS